MNKITKLGIHNIAAKAALKVGSEAWVLKKREEQRLEATQMKFLRVLLGITKWDKDKNQCIGVSYPYRTTANIIVLYILIFNFLHRKLEDNSFYTEY